MQQKMHERMHVHLEYGREGKAVGGAGNVRSVARSSATLAAA